MTRPPTEPTPASAPQTSPPAEAVLIVEVRPSRFNRWLLPPLLLILLAAGLTLWRVRTPDWHWGAGSETPVAQNEPPAEAPQLAQAEPPPAPAPEPEASVETQPPGPAEVPVAEADPAPAPKSDIEAEAERVRVERKAMERLKEEEGERLERERQERLARRTPFDFGFGAMPPFGGGMPADPEARFQAMRQHQEQMRQRAEAHFAEMHRLAQQFQAQAQARARAMSVPPPPIPRPGESVQAFQRRIMREMQRQMLEMDQEMRRHFEVNPPDFEFGPMIHGDGPHA